MQVASDPWEQASYLWREFLEKKKPRDYICIYIHVPFCTQRCNYCHFSSEVCSIGGIPETSIDQLVRNLQFASSFFKTEQVRCVVFGGGTCNVLTERQLVRIVTEVRKSWNCENASQKTMFALELHPAHITSRYIETIRDLNFFNRISMGIQTFDPEVLKLENRLAISRESFAKICDQFHEFIPVINVDLIAGLKGQTPEILVSDASFLLSTLQVESMFIYGLDIVRSHEAVQESSVPYQLQEILAVYNQFKDSEIYEYSGIRKPEDYVVDLGNTYFKKYLLGTGSYNPSSDGLNNILGFSLGSAPAKSLFSSLEKGYYHKYLKSVDHIELFELQKLRS